MAPHPAQTGVATRSWQFQQVGFTRRLPRRGRTGRPGRSLHKVKLSPQEQERLDKGLRNTKPVLTMDFSKSSSEPFTNR